MTIILIQPFSQLNTIHLTFGTKEFLIVQQFCIDIFLIKNVVEKDFFLHKFVAAARKTKTESSKGECFLSTKLIKIFSRQ